MEPREILLAITELKSSIDKRFDAIEKQLDKRLDSVDEQLYKIKQKLELDDQVHQPQTAFNGVNKQLELLSADVEYAVKMVNECDRKLFRIERKLDNI